MIPLGNWQDRIDELESENFDLTEKNTRLEEEIGYYKTAAEIWEQASDSWRKRAGDGEYMSKLHYRNSQGAERRLAELEERLAVERQRAEDTSLIARITEKERDEAIARAEEAESLIDRFARDTNEANDRAESAEARVKELETHYWSAIHSARAEYDFMESRLREEWALRKAAEAERDEYKTGSAAWESSFLLLEHMHDEVQQRANSWFEAAKDMTRARNAWVDVANTHLDGRIEAQKDLKELKSALRVLGQ
ncbi:hypothetical protein LZ318_11715 [Saccharopolyspora indica]|uniref:hypothetical protein n=1 Tax=Saccharopolyspora indica TaxID=1229659 RepID=UPI0022EB3860|nr:hypothetical protein [Saccharopolyspora indica]MDA3643822.1 hypothetical protein [Saccharopolyspora indica]